MKQRRCENPGRPTRAQLVVSMAVVVTVALVPVAAAYLQLGYASTPLESRSSHADDVTRVLDRSVADATGEVSGEYSWAEWSAAIDELRTRLEPALSGISSMPGHETSSVQVEYNQTDASRIAANTCPGGEGRQFGPCRAAGGIVVQERAGETTIVAASFDVRIRTPDSSATITTRIDP